MNHLKLNLIKVNVNEHSLQSDHLCRETGPKE
jgi:hypothetical protein